MVGAWSEVPLSEARLTALPSQGVWWRENEGYDARIEPEKQQRRCRALLESLCPGKLMASYVENLGAMCLISWSCYKQVNQIMDMWLHIL